MIYHRSVSDISNNSSNKDTTVEEGMIEDEEGVVEGTGSEGECLSLPTVTGKVPDCHCISPETVSLMHNPCCTLSVI